MKNAYNHIMNIGKYIVTVFIICFASVGCWWLLYPYDPIDVKAPITIQNPCKEVKQGGILIYTLDYDKKMNLVGKISRHLIDTYTIVYAASEGISPVEQKVVNTHLPIPKYATPGTYFLRWSATYQVNPLRKVTVTVDSEKFVVYPKDRTRLCIDGIPEEDDNDYGQH